MARPSITPINQEREFHIDELFFSTTDKKGVIRSGNDVFVRVSGYSPVEELIGQPHNIIRHPDMPRCVFKLLWDYIQAGKGIAAYVKNMTRDGRYYWVVALVVPIRDGYLSVRFKPSSDYFQVIQGLYPELLALERSYGTDGPSRQAGMLASGERMLEALKEKGFDSYDVFMQTALSREISSRRAVLAAHARTGGAGEATASGRKDGRQASLRTIRQYYRSVDSELAGLFFLAESFLDLNEKLRSKSAFLSQLARRIRLLSLNALVESNRLEESGATLTAISDRMARSADDSVDLIAGMTGNILSVVGSLREMAFTISAAKLQVEMALFFVRELLDGTSRPAGDDASYRAVESDAPCRMAEGDATCRAILRTGEDIGALTESLTDSVRQVLANLQRSQEPIQQLKGHTHTLVKALRSLEFIHIIGKIEAARVEHADQFRLTFEEVLQLIQEAQAELRDFSAAITPLDSYIGTLDRTEYSLDRTNRALQSEVAAFREAACRGSERGDPPPGLAGGLLQNGKAGPADAAAAVEVMSL